jgi:protein-disulfide isomerase
VRAGSSLKQFQKAYGDKVQVVFKHFPFNETTHLAHQASIEAHKQGKFWEYHDLVFADMQNIKRPDLERHAQQLGLNMAQFRKALDTGAHKAIIDADIGEARTLGVDGTPSIFINGTKAAGFEFDKLKEAADPILLKKGYKPDELPDAVPLDITMADAPSIGPKDAPVTIVEFSNFQ